MVLTKDALIKVISTFVDQKSLSLLSEVAVYVSTLDLWHRQNEIFDSNFPDLLHEPALFVRYKIDPNQKTTIPG
mgnify:CR=1 FL=1